MGIVQCHKIETVRLFPPLDLTRGTESVARTQSHQKTNLTEIAPWVDPDVTV